MVTLSELFKKKEVKNNYTSGMYAPYAERKDHVVQFELTEGCSYGGCTFCDMYGHNYREKSLSESKDHIHKVLSDMPRGRRKSLERIFIANGDALNMDPLKLNELVQYSIEEFKHYAEKLPRRVAIFGSTRNILAVPKGGLEVMRCGGTCTSKMGLPNVCSRDRFGEKMGVDLIYWGIESGSDNVLQYLGKGCTKEGHLAANRKLESAGIRKSVTIMVGAGGIKYADEHLSETVGVLNRVGPEFITLIGINPSQSTTYMSRMNREIQQGTNRPLTDLELAEQTLGITEGLAGFDTTLGCFDASIQDFGRNPLPFGSVSLEVMYGYGPERMAFIKKQKQRIKKVFKQ